MSFVLFTLFKYYNLLWVLTPLLYFYIGDYYHLFVLKIGIAIAIFNHACNFKKKRLGWSDFITFFWLFVFLVSHTIFKLRFLSKKKCKNVRVFHFSECCCQDLLEYIKNDYGVKKSKII